MVFDVHVARAERVLGSVDFDRLRCSGICRDDYDFIVQYPPSLLLPPMLDAEMLYPKT
jgi:hypothetical protein